MQHTQRTLTARLVGLDARPVLVETTLLPGPPGLLGVGLEMTEAGWRETSVSVQGALAHVGRPVGGAVSVHVSHFEPSNGADLAIAVALARMWSADVDPKGVAFVAGLAMDGRLRPVRGALARVLAAHEAGARQVVVAHGDALEAALADCEVLPASTLAEVLGHFEGRPLEPARPTKLDLEAGHARAWGDVAPTSGLPPRVLLIGHPGSGRILRARGMAAALGPLTLTEALECTAIQSAAGLLGGQARADARPFRAPHHTVSSAGLVGGGSSLVHPGEASLATNGVLLLDELPEFRQAAIGDLGRVLKAGQVTLARKGAEMATFPTRPACVVATANPCPCGYHGHPRLRCKCSEATRERYRARLTRLGSMLGLTEAT